jgi:4-amino-4-deoxychorismate lyase
VNNKFIETIKALDGEVFHISYHQKRYESVLKYFGAKKFENLLDYLNPPKKGLFRCRLVYDLHTIKVTYHEYKKKEIKSIKLVYDDKIDYRFKYEDRTSLNELFEKRDGCDEILIIKNSLVTDTSIANIAFYKDGMWITPKEPLLRGTTRQRLLDSAVLTEADVSDEDLNSFEKVALLNAMIDFDIITQNKKDIFVR